MANDIITQSTYYREITDLAKQCRAEAREYGRDVSEVIHETVDGHSWIIYTRHNLAVLQYSDHEDAAEEMGGLEDVLRSGGVSGLLTYLACAAMMADVDAAVAEIAEEMEEDERNFDNDLDEDDLVEENEEG